MRLESEEAFYEMPVRKDECNTKIYLSKTSSEDVNALK
jgi:hypothetical protein